VVRGADLPALNATAQTANVSPSRPKVIAMSPFAWASACRFATAADHLPDAPGIEDTCERIGRWADRCCGRA
jgi:hypothetical protein